MLIFFLFRLKNFSYFCMLLFHEVTFIESYELLEKMYLFPNFVNKDYFVIKIFFIEYCYLSEEYFSCEELLCSEPSHNM